MEIAVEGSGTFAGHVESIAATPHASLGSLGEGFRGTLCWGPYNRDPTISGIILGCPLCGNSHLRDPNSKMPLQAEKQSLPLILPDVTPRTAVVR